MLEIVPGQDRVSLGCGGSPNSRPQQLDLFGSPAIAVRIGVVHEG